MPKANADPDCLEAAQTPARVKVEDTRAAWLLTACVGWILSRDLCAVLVLDRPFSPLDKIGRPAGRRERHNLLRKLARDAGNKTLENSDKAIDAAWHDLFDKLATGNVTAYGDPGTGQIEGIPPKEFYRFYSPDNVLEDWLGSYRHIAIARDEMLQYWRSQPDAIQDKPTRQQGASPIPKAGYEVDDEPLLEEVHRLLCSRECSSVWQAALKVALRARGNSTLESKAKRLHRRYRKWVQKFTDSEIE
jgi:hypothetical protein